MQHPKRVRRPQTRARSQTRGRRQPPVWLAAALVLATGLAGCAAPGGRSGATDTLAMADATPAGPALSAFLERAPDGAVTTLAASPWGGNVTVYARERYFAASGHECLRLDVSRGAVPAALGSGEVACRVAARGWYTQRLVTEVVR
ncbi:MULTISPECIES: DVU3141 family protein [Salinicola]|uniref:DVU3141 family protein n=1 Tax=Salinicola TaxID=404432 RepID=UPI000DA1B421|nr:MULTISPECIES: DVU3141 family protein [Salinicola]